MSLFTTKFIQNFGRCSALGLCCGLPVLAWAQTTPAPAVSVGGRTTARAYSGPFYTLPASGAISLNLVREDYLSDGFALTRFRINGPKVAWQAPVLPLVRAADSLPEAVGWLGQLYPQPSLRLVHSGNKNIVAQIYVLPAGAGLPDLSVESLRGYAEGVRRASGNRLVIANAEPWGGDDLGGSPFTVPASMVAFDFFPAGADGPRFRIQDYFASIGDFVLVQTLAGPAADLQMAGGDIGGVYGSLAEFIDPNAPVEFETAPDGYQVPGWADRLKAEQDGKAPAGNRPR